MPFIDVQITNQKSPTDPVKIRVIDRDSGAEIFHGEIWNFTGMTNRQTGDGDIDIIAPAGSVLTALEWVKGQQTLTHPSPVGHIACDFRRKA